MSAPLRQVGSAMRKPASMILAGLTLLGAALAQAEPAQGRLYQALDRGTLEVGTTGDYRPFTYLDPASHAYEGIDIDMAQSLATSLGLTLVLVQTSWPTLTQDLLAGKFDLAMGGISISLERQKRGLFSLPYQTDGKTPIARCGEEAKFRELADIDRPGVRVIVNPGGTNERFARQHLSVATIAVHHDNVSIFDEIVAGKADVMITDRSEVLFQHRLRPKLCATHEDQPFDRFEKAYLLPRDVIFKAYVDAWLHQALISGEYDKIAAKWLH
jgi:cyclohexadienyl dehydratase